VSYQNAANHYENAAEETEYRSISLMTFLSV